MTEYNESYPTQQKIKERMDQLQDWMEANHHLEHPDQVEMMISSITKFYPALQEEDIDYLHGARYAIEEKLEWNVPEEQKRINKAKQESK